MNIKCTYLSLQEIGKRSNQEDSIYPELGRHIPDNDLFILCDGMGGHECGEVASRTVCEAMSSYITEHPDSDFESALNAAYDALDAADNSQGKKMGTTMTLLKIEGDSCIVAHIGDSRIYHIRPSDRRVLYVTRDHSLVNSLIACGEMTEEEAKHSRQKNIITRAMQPHQERRAKADVAILTDIKDGDYFYMCSDGMLEISEDEDIVNVLSMDISDEEKMEILKGVTAENSDNHSAHLVHIAMDAPIIATEKVGFQLKERRWPIILISLVFLGLIGYCSVNEGIRTRIRDAFHRNVTDSTQVVQEAADLLKEKNVVFGEDQSDSEEASDSTDVAGEDEVAQDKVAQDEREPGIVETNMGGN